jgi:hypothetical protein
MTTHPAHAQSGPAIGRRTRVLSHAVAAPDGRPIVIVNDPVTRRDGRPVPFPTLYWLVCPDIVRAISQLEHDGVINELQRQLDADEHLRRRLADDHHRYIARRRRLIDIDRHGDIAAHLDGRGIAGMRNFAAVKCLHAHYAQHLADFNTIGELLEQRQMVRRPDVIIHTP